MKNNIYHILLIEDDPGDSLLFNEALNDIQVVSFNVSTVNTLAKAIQIIDKEQFDAVVADLGLPDSNGLDTLISLKEMASTLPILVLTGLEDEKTGLESISIGAQDYLIKGKFDPYTLFRAIRYAIERKQVEESMRDSEQRFRKMAENIQDGIMIFEDDKLVFVNDRTSEILGYTADEILELRGHDVVVPEELGMIEKFVEEYKDSGKVPDELTFWILRKDGERRYIKHHISQIVINGKKNLRFMIVTDLTEQKLAEDALLQSEKKYRLLFDHSPVGIGLTKLDGQVIAVNEKMKEMFGYVGNSCKNLKAIQKFLKDFANPEHILEMTENGGYKNYEVKLNKITGEPLIGKLKAVPFMLDNEMVLLTVSEDITRQYQMQGDLVRAKEKAEESDKLKSAFLLNLSHEIRTPLNAILGFSELIQNSLPADSTSKDYLSHIMSAGLDLLKLAEDTIDMTKLENEQICISMAWENINDTLDQLQKAFCRIIEDKYPGISFIYKGELEPLPVYTDHNLLSKVISCLLDNAAKFTEQGSVVLGVRSNGNNTIEIFVKDTGIGIPPDKQHLIFDKFCRIERPDKVFRGNGLGLSITDRLVKALGGKILLESEMNKGSEFIVSLPVSDEKRIRT